jgi:CRISPR type III-A-associated protein Csm2
MNYQRNQQQQTRTNVIGDINLELKNSPKPIHQLFSKEDLFLPGGKAHKIAEALRDLNINQLRKVFDYFNRAEELAKDNKIDQALETLFMVVPMVAYANGRKLINPREFNDFIQIVITPQRLKNKEDILTIHKFMQSILAYKKN